MLVIKTFRVLAGLFHSTESMGGGTRKMREKDTLVSEGKSPNSVSNKILDHWNEKMSLEGLKTIIVIFRDIKDFNI